MLGWVLFRAHGLGDAGVVLAHLFAPTSGLELAPATLGVLAGVVGLVFAAHLVARFADVEALARRAPAPLAAGALALAILLAQLLAPEGGGAFIYFQF